MIRQALTLSAAFLVLWGCAPVWDQSTEGTLAAREFATQKEGVCCYVGYRPLKDGEKPKVDQEKVELARQLAAANAALATKEQERADLARQLDAMISALAGLGDKEELARQMAAAKAALAAKEQERAELLARQLEAMKEAQAGQGVMTRQLEEARAALAAKEREKAELARQLDAAKGGEKVTAAELAKMLREKRAVALRNIFFDINKATIKPESDIQLAEVGQLLKEDQALQLQIQGHTDNIGEKAYNLTLSQARAAAVKDYVVTKYGIAADRLTTVGFGVAKPVATNATPQGRALNRRVELVKR